MIKSIPGHPDYEIDICGRVWSLKFGKRKQLKPSANPSGYPFYGLRTGGRYHQKMAHVLVLETFVGPCPAGFESRHLDDNKQNCQIDNLRWGTRSENNLDRAANGKGVNGSKNPMAKLTEKDVLNIRKEIEAGERGVLTRIAAKYHVSIATVSLIKDRKNWAHLDS